MQISNENRVIHEEDLVRIINLRRKGSSHGWDDDGGGGRNEAILLDFGPLCGSSANSGKKKQITFKLGRRFHFKLLFLLF